MLPRDVIESGFDAGCVRLYAYIIRAEGPDASWTVAGAAAIGDLIEMQAETLLGHAEHLAAAGMIAYERHGRGKFVFRILHNPAQGRVNPTACIPPPQPRARKPSKYSTPVPRSSPVIEARPSRVSTPEDRGTPTELRPTSNTGHSKSAEKYEGLDASDAREKGDEELCAFPGCTEAIDGHSFLHEPVTPTATITAVGAIDFSEVDWDYEIVDASDEVLDQAPWTDAPLYDSAALERLFADASERSDGLRASYPEGERVGMKEDEALATLLRAFPGAELVAG